MNTLIALGWEERPSSHIQKYLTQGMHSKIGVKCAPAELIYEGFIFQKKKKKKNQENNGEKNLVIS